MTLLNVPEEFKRMLAAKKIQRDILTADEFSLTLHYYDGKGDHRLHDCGKDEFFYVIKGTVEMQVENEVIPLKEGQGLLVKAGDKHKRLGSNQAWIIMISKKPHRHRRYN